MSIMTMTSLPRTLCLSPGLSKIQTWINLKAMGFNVPEGTWMTSYKINDEATWKQIKEGKLNGFSIAGNFIEKATR